jgi:NTP pyrophosphatase (non-canonical NTP hydrolase)
MKMSNKEPLTISQYELNAIKTAIRTEDRDKDLARFTLGIPGEVGEVCEIIKKHNRGDYNLFEDGPLLVKMKKELGDVIWYLTAVGHVLGIRLEDIMETNNEKLLDRLERNKIKGSGDDR